MTHMRAPRPTVSIILDNSASPVAASPPRLPQSQGAGIAATVVFALHSIVNVEIPLQTTNFESRMYELLVQEVEVENPFSGDCDFTVSLMPFEHASEKDKKEHHKAARAPAVAKQRTGLGVVAGDEDHDKEVKKKNTAVRSTVIERCSRGQSEARCLLAPRLRHLI